MGSVTLSLVDISKGKPASNVEVSVYKITNNALEPVLITATNKEGMTEVPILNTQTIQSGQYQLIIHTASYFQSNQIPFEAFPFLETIMVRFGISDHSKHYKITITLTASGYSVHRVQLQNDA